MDDTDTERRLLAQALRETTGAVEFAVIPTVIDMGEPADSLGGLDWRDYESAVRSPGGGGR